MSRILFAALVMFAVLQAIAPLVAQDEDPLGVPTDIEKAFKQGNPSKAITSTPLTANDKTILDNTAKYYAWRVTWLENVALPEKQALALKEFEQFYSGPGSAVVKAGPTAEGVKFFNTKLIEYMKAVLDRKFDNNRVSSVYAGQMLPIMAKGKSTEVGKFLLDLVKDPGRHDAIKLYALRGLRESPAVRAFPNANEVRDIKVMAPDVERVKILTAYIERDWPKTDNKEELAAFSYLRREAVQALAAVQVPAVILVNKKGKEKLEGPVAVTLLQVLSKGGLEPAPSLSERCEAALGLCHLKISDVPDYQPQLAVYAVGVAVSDFLNKYRADFGNFGDGKKKAPEMSWKIYGDRLKQGLDALEKEIPAGHAASGTVKGITARTKNMLDSVVKHQAVDNAAAIAYREWILTQKPANNNVFGGGVKAPPVNLDGVKAPPENLDK